MSINLDPTLHSLWAHLRGLVRGGRDVQRRDEQQRRGDVQPPPGIGDGPHRHAVGEHGGVRRRRSRLHHIFQTGSGTSTNMNANEVIATRAQQLVEGAKIHPNDHVNVCQSSNDVIPAAIHIAAVLESQERLLPALRHLHGVLVKKARETDDVVKTGRTHLMDAMPIRLSQQIGGWASQIAHSHRSHSGSFAADRRIGTGRDSRRYRH